MKGSLNEVVGLTKLANVAAVLPLRRGVDRATAEFGFRDRWVAGRVGGFRRFHRLGRRGRVLEADGLPLHWANATLLKYIFSLTFGSDSSTVGIRTDALVTATSHCDQIWRTFTTLPKL